jgi:DNA-binding PadR family transcriptional regulator
MSVKHALLAMLYREALHGYELGKQLPVVLRTDWDVKPGQIASTLARLERDELVIHETQAVPDAPERKVYQLTEAGVEMLRQWYNTAEIRDYRMGDSFYIKLVFSLISAPATPEAVIMTHRRRLFKELHDLTALRESLDRKADMAYILLLETAILHLDADLRWLDMCEARLPELKQFQTIER